MTNTKNNNYNDNNYDDSTMDNIFGSNSSNLVAEADLSTPAQKLQQPATTSALYKLAARNLREYHGVPSMTALKLEKTLALLSLPPRRVVVQGLAPRKLLEGGQSGLSPLVLAGDFSDEGKEELGEAETGVLMDQNLTNPNGSEDQEEEEVGQECSPFSDNSNSHNIRDNMDQIGDNTKGDVEGFPTDGNGNGKTRHPVHAALVAGGINLRPRETRPLLRALGVSPHHLVKLGLVSREAVRTRRRGGAGQYLRARRPRKAGVERPRGPPLGPPHACGCGASSGCGPSRPMHDPRRRPFHGDGHHIMHLGWESEEEGMSAPLGPGPHAGPGHRSLRHRPGHHSMPIVGLGRGPPGGGEHGHGHRHPPHGHGLDGGGLHGERRGEGGGRLLGGARGAGQHGPRHHVHHGEVKGRPRGRPMGPPPHGPPHGGPPHGPPHGPFHGLFDEGGSGAPCGMMAYPRHGSPSPGGGGMKLRGGRHGGGMGFCGDGGRGGGVGGDMEIWGRAHLAHFEGRHQPQLEAY